ncbi:hypothetical protein N7449_009566 [Penicillium cf. viridicatum]|uniref:Zn(2)-C6 fungal-type domain-containing protein n=1 Tax=Penicillium cf. viridicatum TaxID=2972119 RepID=A0A9W9JAB0_9EURO|nr:hypothetical protein N7449_009566 [Penicillium cf. viridicatum]
MSQEGARKRVSLACTPCRKKRSRCDGEKPICGSCLKEQRQCEYSHQDEKRKPPSKRYVQALHARIENLETQLLQYENAQKDATQPPNTMAAAMAIQVPLPRKIPADEPQKPKSEDPLDDLVDLYGALSFAEGQELRYYDSRSNLGLVHQQLDTSSVPIFQMPSKNSHHRGDSFEVPPDVQEHLLELYWKWQNPWQYLIHEERFRRDLEQGSSHGYCTPLLLYSMLAIASRYSDRPDIRTNPDDPSTAGDAIAEHAKLLLFDELEAPAVSTVIAAVLLSLKEMSVNKEPVGWTYMGMATRMAYNLGFHIDPSKWVKSGHLTEEDASIRSIAWWGCYMVEKLFNQGVGRPSMISERNILAPLPPIVPNIEYGLWEDTEMASQKGSLISYCTSTFRYTCEMLRMTAGPLDEIYAINGNMSPPEKENLIVQTNLRLSAFYDKLPSFLRLTQSSAKNPLPPHIYLFQYVSSGPALNLSY